MKFNFSVAWMPFLPLVIVGLTAAASSAQEIGDEPPLPEDPTRPSPQLQQALEAEQPPPLPVPPTRDAVGVIPDFKVRGRIVLNSATVAVVELEGEYHQIREGDERVIRNPTGTPLTFTVSELGPRILRIKFPGVAEEVMFP